MDADTVQMLRASLTKVLTEGTERPLSERLADLGWDAVLDDDGPASVRVLFETKGATVATGDALGPVMAGAVAASVGAPGLGSASVVIPSSLRPERPSARVEGGRLFASGVLLARPGAGAPVIVPVAGPDGAVRLAVAAAPVTAAAAAPVTAAAAAPVTADGGAEWSCTAVDGTDPDLGMVRISAVVDESALTWMDPGAASIAWEAAVAAGRWALAAELLGVAGRVLAGAVAYAGDRHQYGRPIGSFQAVQHRLAAAHASVVGASHVVEEASTSGSPWVAMVAKAVAGRAAEVACTQAQQTYGAIGFTWEHGLHRCLRRTYALDWLLGDWRSLEQQIGLRLQQTREVPRIGAL